MVHDHGRLSNLSSQVGRVAQIDAYGGTAYLRLRPHWRGRMGLSKEEQLQFFETQQIPDNIQAPDTGSDEEDEIDSSDSSSDTEYSSDETSSSSSDDAPEPLR